MGFRAGPQAKPGEQVQGDGFLDLINVLQAVGAGISGGETGVILNDLGVLDVPVPGLLGRLRGCLGPGSEE
jgi:hypothetical protein